MSIFLEETQKFGDYIQERTLDLGDNYLEFNYPADISEIEDAYAYFNKTYFDNELPKNIPIYYSTLATKVYGKAKLQYGDTKANSSYQIMLASAIKNDRKLLNDVLLHEMIHIWQYYNYITKNDRKYLDHSFFDNSGHGKLFGQWIKKLNREGFNVTTVIDVESEIELEQSAYCLIISAGEDTSVLRLNSEYILLWSFQDFQSNIDDIVEEIQGSAGSSFNTVDYFTTKDSSVINGVRITKAGKIPKGRVNFTIPKDLVDLLLGSSLTTIILNKNKIEIDDSVVSDIPSDIVQLVSHFNKEKGKITIKAWYKAILFNSEDYGYLYRAKGIETKDFFENKFPEDLKNFLRNEWLNITDAQIKRSKLFKNLFQSMKWVVMQAGGDQLKLKLDKRSIDDLEYNYNEYFVDPESGKVSADKNKLKVLFIEFYVSQIVKDSKKTRRPVDKKLAFEIYETVGNKILQGTWLET